MAGRTTSAVDRACCDWPAMLSDGRQGTGETGGGKETGDEAGDCVCVCVRLGITPQGGERMPDNDIKRLLNI